VTQGETVSDTATTTDLSKEIRKVTDREVEFFDENGWVKLDKLVSRTLADELFAHMHRVINDRREGGSDHYVDEITPDAEEGWMRSYVASTNLRESDPWIARLAASRPLAEVAAQLLHTRPLRLWSDSVFFKPRMQADGTTGPGTPWHQDYPSMPFDRAIACGIWIAAVEITPDMGSLQYMSGSHREMPLGKGATFRSPNGAADVYPWLLDKYEISPAFHMQPGDALVHHSLTMHFSEPNRSTTHDRWAWTSQRFDARTGYNGADNHRSDRRGLVVDETFDHPMFPIVID